MAPRIIALAAGLVLAPAAFSQTVYCSAPEGYVGFNSAGLGYYEAGTDQLYDGQIGPSLFVSDTGTNCTPLTDWPYYTLTDPPGDPPATGPQLGLSGGPSAAPEIDPTGAIGAMTLLIGALAVLRGRRRTQCSTVEGVAEAESPVRGFSSASIP